MRVIDEIFGEIFEKNILGEINCISLSRETLEQLKADYAEEFEMELLESGRKVSDMDIKEHLGKPLIVMEQTNGKRYTLLRSI